MDEPSVTPAGADTSAYSGTQLSTLEEPDERLGEKPYLHCLGRGGRTDQMDEMRDVVANATAATAELLLAPPRAVSGACYTAGGASR